MNVVNFREFSLGYCVCSINILRHNIEFSISTSAPLCVDPMIPVECVPCQRTCYHVRYPEMTCDEPETCMEGCICPDGYVWHESICIEEAQCPCIENGEIILIGQTIPGETTCEEW